MRLLLLLLLVGCGGPIRRVTPYVETRWLQHDDEQQRSSVHAGASFHHGDYRTTFGYTSDFDLGGAGGGSSTFDEAQHGMFFRWESMR